MKSLDNIYDKVTDHNLATWLPGNPDTVEKKGRLSKITSFK